MKRYYEKRPEFFVFTYDEEEILPKDVRDKLYSYGYSYTVESRPINETSVYRVLILTHKTTVHNQRLPVVPELQVGEGEMLMFDEVSKNIRVVSPVTLHRGFEEAF